MGVTNWGAGRVGAVGLPSRCSMIAASGLIMSKFELLLQPCCAQGVFAASWAHNLLLPSTNVKVGRSIYRSDVCYALSSNTNERLVAD